MDPGGIDQQKKEFFLCAVIDRTCQKSVENWYSLGSIQLNYQI